MAQSSILAKKNRTRAVFVYLMLLFLISTTNHPFAQTNTDTAQQTTAIGTSKIWGTVDGIVLEGLVQSPSSAKAPLQVACVFEYTENDIYKSPPALPADYNGMVHVDKALYGLITDLRKSGQFKGHLFETLLLTPPQGTINSKKLLLIGLGDRNTFNADVMTDIGAVALREALTLGVDSFAFASDLKDAGIDSPTALVAGNVAKGILNAYRTQAYLKSKHMSSYKPIQKVMLLAGPAFFTTAGEGIKEAILTFKN